MKKSFRGDLSLVLECDRVPIPKLSQLDGYI